MKAIISDVHGNLAALEAVLEDIDSKDVDEIVCLGDVVGYGPEPVACLEKLSYLMDGVRCVMGNHEEAVTAGSADSFTSRAKRAIEWTKVQLFGPEGNPHPDAQARMELLSTLPTIVERDGTFYVHGSPRNHTREYITPRDVRNKSKMKAIFDQLETFCFAGHTHIAGVFTEEGFSTPADLMNIYLTGTEKAIVNVGSVGQPRDGNPKASYATFDGDTVIFRRVDYDVNRTADLIYSISELDRSLGDRIKVGR
ncbi:MAG: metallophosphoesterase family protein [Planctomycetes bacterium]|nr:metallophosphoesterase family protein [Planctomycetota bacterium]